VAEIINIDAEAAIATIDDIPNNEEEPETEVFYPPLLFKQHRHRNRNIQRGCILRRARIVFYFLGVSAAAFLLYVASDHVPAGWFTGRLVDSHGRSSSPFSVNEVVSQSDYKGSWTSQLQSRTATANLKRLVNTVNVGFEKKNEANDFHDNHWPSSHKRELKEINGYFETLLHERPGEWDGDQWVFLLVLFIVIDLIWCASCFFCRGGVLGGGIFGCIRNILCCFCCYEICCTEGVVARGEQYQGEYMV